MKTYNFDFDKGDFVVKNKDVEIISDEEALKLWINKILRTQLNRYSIYKGTGYGANTEDLIIGKSYGYGFTESELEREIEAALLKNGEIKGINQFSIERKSSKLIITIDLNTVYGQMTEVQNYDI